jgi:NADPH:quinone reductase-like Zn-dependent oxidoreductase
MAVTIPKTQKAAVVEKPGKDAKAVVKEIPVEEPKEGEVLIKMLATGGSNSGLFPANLSVSYRLAFAERRLDPCIGHEGPRWWP